MRKYLLPSALILLLGLGAAFAQVLTKSIQLSQDPSGPLGFDTYYGVYFPGHIISSAGRPIPTVSSGGTNTPSITGTDTAGVVTMGTSAASASVTFGTAYVSAPWCAVTWQATGSTATPTSYSPATTGIIITQGATGSNKVNYFCTSAS